jgi:hypothetical protein
VTREAVGERGWPLAVGEADVGCDGPSRAPRLYVRVAGVRYGLNEYASPSLGYADLGRATVGARRPLWTDAPTTGKRSTRALQAEALDACHP